MEDIGGILSVNTAAGDVILLDGDLGAGKTCFSRGFIRGRTGIRGGDETNSTICVTSPTYLLSNTYPLEDGINIHHMDLYRLSSGGLNDLAVLDIDNAFTNGICLVEWPSRLVEKPVARLDITLSIDSATSLTTKAQVGDSDDDNSDEDDNDSIGRLMQLVPHGARWQERLRFLQSEGYFDDLLV